MASYQKTANINGSAMSHLKAVPQVDSASGLVSKALAKVPAQQQKLVEAALQVVLATAHDSAQNQILLDSKLADVILMRIASLLETFKTSLVDEDLQAAKDEIISKIEGMSEEFISKLIKEYLAKQLVNLFDSPATKDDIEELKAYLEEVSASTKLNSESQQASAQIVPENAAKSEEDEALSQDEEEDAEEGQYLDSTPAKNFFVLQTYIGQQFEQLNATISRMTSAKMSPSAVRGNNKMMKMFEKIGGVVQKVVGILKKVIEPAISFVTGLIKKYIIIPILAIAIKIGIIIAAITLIAIGIVLAVKWIKDKIVQFVKYVMSGQMWKDIKEKLLGAWEWLKDFGKFIWDKTVEALKFIFVDIWVELGKWIWQQLTDFWNWCYDNFIGPYLVEPLKKAWAFLKGLWTETIYPKIKPFVESAKALIDKLKNLGGAIKQAILDWWNGDSSLGDTLKNIGSMVGGVIKDWWETSPFNAFYQKHLKPFVDSAANLFKRLANLGGFIKQAILDWWNGDSSLGDTLKNIGTTVWNAIKEWWDTSIFKKYWEKAKMYLSNLLQPLRDWWNESWLGKTFQAAWTSLKETWDSFKQAWDSFSIIDSLKNIGTTIKDGLVAWYEQSSIKQWIDKVADFGQTIAESFNKWYEQSSLKTIIDKIKELLDVYVIAPLNGIRRKIAAFVAKLANEFVIKVPSMNFNGSAAPWNWKIDWNEFRPFDFATKGWTPEQKQQAAQDADKSAADLIQEEMTKMEELIAKSKPQVVQNSEENTQTTIQNSQEVAQQVVNNQMQPIQEMEQAKAEQRTQADESFASVAKAKELEQQHQREQDIYRDTQSQEMFQFIRDMRYEMNSGFAKPNVIPAPVMITNNAGPNPAAVENR